ncbi:MAG: hypothetical protein IPI91_12960 [Flavobacteriales bacterium]|nr:hypothetical protein [Flavobacteriales bacterium]
MRYPANWRLPWSLQKVFLDGPYNSSTQLMNDGLRTNGLIPTTQPYSQLGYTVLGALTTTSAVLAVSGNNAIVDWVLVELRGTSSPYAVVETRAGLLQRDGDIVAVNGTSALGFCVNLRKLQDRHPSSQSFGLYVRIILCAQQHSNFH